MFLLFGGSAALVSLVSGKLLYDYQQLVKLPYQLAVFLAAVAGMFVSFAMNYIFNYKFNGRSIWGQFLTFTWVSLIGMGLSAVFAEISLIMLEFIKADFSSFLHIKGITNKFAAHIISIVIVTIYSYAAHTYFSFNVGIRSRVQSWLRSKAT
ncbi:GtrA family protein [Nitrospirillum sp. BR 11163]|uniref:GtrA family protein n=1 Tax=Nitrospirillum sp. BR 11163 TaxID=3104323 RepID=UPI002AFE5477|nr:GtrA family protein [Nitrospirillum sp. BR 11163]MEA1672502.1 GtrA family protein [Nitrospirillum sp. BR 11163]